MAIPVIQSVLPIRNFCFFKVKCQVKTYTSLPGSLLYIIKSSIALSGPSYTILAIKVLWSSSALKGWNDFALHKLPVFRPRLICQLSYSLPHCNVPEPIQFQHCLYLLLVRNIFLGSRKSVKMFIFRVRELIFFWNIVLWSGRWKHIQ